jgi:hypothetical protein
MLTEELPVIYLPYQRLSATWEEIQKVGYDKAVEIVKSWDEVELKNNEIYKHNNALYILAVKRTEEFFKECGVKYNKTNAYGKVTGKYKEATVFLEALAIKYRINRPFKPSMSSITYKNERISTVSGNALLTLESAKYNVERSIRKEQETSVQFKESLKTATENNINISECGNPEEVYRTVNEFMKDKFIVENYPDGTEMYLKHGCDNCSEWTVGEHRCSCGNRRVYLSVDGDFILGFYAYPACY